MDELVAKLKLGDMHAFRMLIEKYKYQSYSLALGIVKDKAIAEEIIQDSFFTVYQKIETFTGSAKFSTWLYRIVVNHSLRSRDKNRIEFSVFEPQDSTSDVELVDIEFNTSEINDYLIEKECADRKHLINHIFQQLSDKEQSLLRLFYLEEQTIQDIEVITELGKSDIKMTLHRARKHFFKLAELTKNKEIKYYVN